MENIVYLELLRRGYDVFIGKVGDLEIDFVAQKGQEVAYFQVSATVFDPATYEHEMRPLKQVKDNFPKCLLTLDDLTSDDEGIRHQNILEFLLEE